MKLIQGDCFDEIPKLEDDSLDLVLTDFPYNISFISKDWDSVEENFYYKVGKALLPKMKAGSFLVTTFTPRMDMLWRCLSELERAGFEMKTSPLFWLYHTGFPKASDMAKMIDKQKGTFKEGKITENARFGLEGDKGNYNHSKVTRETNPQSDEAKLWSGWKSFQMKPSVEMIICVQKPRTEKTIVGQVLENGCGAVNIEKSRIPFENEKDKYKEGVRKAGSELGQSSGWNDHENRDTLRIPSYGRFPANLLVSGEPLKGYSKSGSMNVHSKGFDSSVCYGNGETVHHKAVASEGSPNRFYSLDAWWEKRNITLCEDSAFFDVPKPSKSEKNKGLEGVEPEKVRDGRKAFVDNAFQRGETLRLNKHPTTKPVKLFTYLAELFSRKGATVLDPFMGSGTTGIACSILGREFIGIELEKDYFEIAEARIKEVNKQSKLILDSKVKTTEAKQ